jgi:6-phosphogluconolactonase (cycloisomerase 2 family)
MLKKAVALFLVCVGLAVGLSCGKTTSRYLYAAIPTASQILVYREDPNSGVLTPLATSPFTAGQGVQSIVIHPSGQFLYAANSSLDNISLFKIDSQGALTEQTPRTNAGTTPALLVMDPAGSYLYVANAESNDVWVFSITSSTGVLAAVGAPTPLGLTPLNMALSKGGFLYVTGAGSPGYVEVFSLSAGVLTLVQVQQAGTNPYGLAIDPKGLYLYTANFGDNSISEFSIGSSTSPEPGGLTELPGSPVGVPNGTGNASPVPIALLVDNSGQYLYVANEGSANLSAYAVGSGGGLTLLSSNYSITTGAQPSLIASDPSGQYLFVANQKSGSTAIESFSLATSDGALSEVGSYSVPATAASIAVAP